MINPSIMLLVFTHRRGGCDPFRSTMGLKMLEDLLHKEQEGDATPKPVRSRAKKWLGRTSIVAGALVLTMVAAAGLYLGSVNSNIKRADLLTVTAEAAPNSAKGAINILILGQNPTAKSEAGEVVMILHLSADRKSAHLVSFPKGLFVKVPGHGRAALNTTYATGGSNLTIRTVQNLTKTRIDHVIIVGYTGFAQLSQQVGTITVNNPTAFKVGNLSFDKGEISLTNSQALIFVQERKDVADDLAFAKPERQRLVLEASLQQGIGKGLLNNPTRFGRFVRSASKSTTVDRALTGGQAAKIALSMKLSKDDVQIIRVPLSDEVVEVQGQEVPTVDAAQFKELVTAMSTDTLTAYAEEYPNE